jgi:hypothetical protein
LESPLAGDSNVVAQVPREIVAKVLRTAIDLPSTERLEVVVIQGPVDDRGLEINKLVNIFILPVQMEEVQLGAGGR